MLFLKDSYLKKFKTTIQKIEGKNIILEETAFYAKSGGQPGDIGKIFSEEKKINIIDTIYSSDKKIIHISESTENLKTGEQIQAEIDWEIRYKHMRMHSALHLLCSLIPFDVTGGLISNQKSRLDFNASEKIEKIDIEIKINQLVKENHEITYQWITNEELDKKPELIRTMSVKPPRTNNKIRLVKIGNIDLQPCGGTHVRSTKEIGEIKIGKIENKGKINKRVNLLLND